MNFGNESVTRQDSQHALVEKEKRAELPSLGQDIFVASRLNGPVDAAMSMIGARAVANACAAARSATHIGANGAAIEHTKHDLFKCFMSTPC